MAASVGLTIVAAMVLSSFSRVAGVDSFEIYLNEKLLLRQSALSKDGVQTIGLADASGNDLLNVYYDHCGRIGTDRSISIKDSRDNILREWHFANASKGSPGATMSIKLSELRGIGHEGASMKLAYSSGELAGPKMLVFLFADKLSEKASR